MEQARAGKQEQASRQQQATAGNSRQQQARGQEFKIVCTHFFAILRIVCTHFFTILDIFQNFQEKYFFFKEKVLFNYFTPALDTRV